ncbi:unnamed protein product [Rhodiola kirilowii]
MSKDHGGIVKAWGASIKKSQSAAKRKAASIFKTMSVAHAEDPEEELLPGPSPDGLITGEKVLCNGDVYTGQWLENLPNGYGRYLWTAGCVYEGEFFRGKFMGKGRFSWPSGAIYDGEFKSNYMVGKGVYTCSSGDIYRGQFAMNLKHGQGVKMSANGDQYDGEWRRGNQDGHGRYQWKNGNLYIGQWKHGLMNGYGTMTWANGNKYEGNWEDGLPKENGTYKWPDGRYYIGEWNKNPEEQNGTFYSASGDPTGDDGNWDPREVFEVDLVGCKISPDAKVPIWPFQKMHNWPGFEGEILQKPMSYKPPRHSNAGQRMSNDGSASPYNAISGRPSTGSLDGDGYESDISIILQKQFGSRPKRQGVTISKGHKNYDLMLNLQLGIRHSVGRPGPIPSLDLKTSAFDPKEKVWTRFPPEGSKHTPPHHSCEFKWKDYCPLVFRTLRKMLNVDPADYMISICGDDALRELSSPGKSGSFFYLTNDDKYMIKTMKKAEVKVLLRMLHSYYNHVRTYENTLVTRFVGLHCVKLTGNAQKKVRFVIMGNLFCTQYTIHRRFDLKGSSFGRSTDKPESEVDPNTTLKDLDLNYIFRLQKTWFQEFCRQVYKDCDFLEQERIMDYSLLVGLHFREYSDGNPENGRLSNADSEETSQRLGIRMSARAERTARRKTDGEPQLVGEPTGKFYDVILFFGIIDILQDYDISKKIEHAYKSMHHDPGSISAVEPRLYARRFRDFIFKVFAEDT